MKQGTKKWLGIGAVLAVVFLTGILASALKPENLPDFEQRCMKTADPLERQEIALDATDFLMQQEVPAPVAQEIQQAAVAEKPTSTLEMDWAIVDSVAMNDSLWALCESRLSQFLPSVYYLKHSADPTASQIRLARAKSLAEKIDAYNKNNYWAALLDFLNKADSTTWHNWRMAVISNKKSQEAYNVSKYDFARWFAIYGIKCLAQIPVDRRLYLDLCFRLQNAIAEGESTFRLAFAFGDWIIKESMAIRYCLRAVSMEYNIANQLYRPGRYDEMIERLKNVQHLTRQWREFCGMEWYGRRALERLAAALYELGEYQAASQNLEVFGKITEGNTEAALYHIDKGQIAEAYGKYEIAEQEFLSSIAAAKGNSQDDDDDDSHNVWEAYHYLGDLFLNYDLPDRAITHYREAARYIKSRRNFLNNDERAAYSLVRLAEAQIRQNRLDEAKKTLSLVEKKLQLVDSPLRLVECVTKAATLYQVLNEHQEAENRLGQALDICRQYGLFTEEIKVILQKAEFSLQRKSEGAKPIYPVDELSQVIDKLRSNNDKSQLIQALALLIDAAYKSGRTDLACEQANLLLAQAEALNQQYAREERLIFFQHSIYKNIKTAIQLEILLGRLDSALVKLSAVKGRALRGRIVGPNEKPLNLTETQQALQNSEAVLDYMVTSDTLYTFILTRSALQLVRTPANKQQLQADIDAYVDYLKNDSLFDNKTGKTKLEKIFLESVQQSSRLYRTIFGNVAPRLQGLNRLYVIPDEFLYALPFGTLTRQTGRNSRFLAEDKAVMVLPGAWMLTVETDSETTSNEAKMLASIDINMPGAANIKKYLGASLEHDADVYTQWQDKNTFKRQLTRNYRYYLFYAHAAANWEEPRHSWIEFPLNSTDNMDRLSYDEVDSLDWQQVDLVILAGCETSGSRIYLGAGLTGLQRAFLAAGAQQVLATYWKVIAVLAAEQIRYFLNVWEQHDALFALQSMQKAAIEQLRNDPVFKYPHPQLWGAYNLTGIKPNIRQAIKMATNQ